MGTAVPREAPGGRTPRQLTRRTVLAGSASIAVTGCSTPRREEPAPHPDVSVLIAAIATEQRLIALYEAVRGTHTDLAGRLEPLLAHHRDHLGVLRRHYRPGTRSHTPAPTPPAATAPRGRRAAVAALRGAERRAAAARVNDVQRVGPALAQLLASIGACEAGHVAVLARMP